MGSATENENKGQAHCIAEEARPWGLGPSASSASEFIHVPFVYISRSPTRQILALLYKSPLENVLQSVGDTPLMFSRSELPTRVVM